MIPSKVKNKRSIGNIKKYLKGVINYFEYIASVCGKSGHYHTAYTAEIKAKAIQLVLDDIENITDFDRMFEFYKREGHIHD